MFFVLVIRLRSLCFFFFNDTATTEIYTLSLHDALPIYPAAHLSQLLYLTRGLAHERFEGHQPSDRVADLPPVLVRDLARGRRGQGGLGAVLGHPARHLGQALRRFEPARDLALLRQDALANHAGGLR